MGLFRRRGARTPNYPRTGLAHTNPLVCSSINCDRKPIFHIALGIADDGTLDVSQACARCWIAYGRHHFRPEHVHPFQGCCGMPGTAWDFDNHRCIQGEIAVTEEREMSEAERLINEAFS